jgi:hypothetical protein
MQLCDRIEGIGLSAPCPLSQCAAQIARKPFSNLGINFLVGKTSRVLERDSREVWPIVGIKMVLSKGLAFWQVH